MSDLDRIHAACVNAQNATREIDDDIARLICSQWHAGQHTAMYAFASSGHYDRAELLEELSDVIRTDYTAQGERARLSLDMLGTYFINRREA